MKKLFGLIFLSVFIFFALSGTAFSIDVTQCQNLDSANTVYDLTTNFTNTTAICFPITAENITLDCHGYTITRSIVNTKFVNASAENITVKNCVVETCEYGVWSEPTAVNLLVQNNTFKCSSYHTYLYGENALIKENSFHVGATYGVALQDVTSGTIFNNTFDESNNMDYGILLWNANNTNTTFNQFQELTAGSMSAGIYLYDAYNNTIYNNFFNITTYVELGGSETNYWNVTKQYGTRIYGNGTVLGGNFYTNHSGTAFSDTCTDTDQDGLCDSSYTVATGNIDYLPMSLNFTNHAPTASSARLYSTTNTTAVPLQGFCTGTDPDYEPLRYYCLWYLEGVLNSTNCSENYFTQGAETNVANLTGNNLYVGNWSLGCLASDATANSSQVNSTYINITQAEEESENPIVTNITTNSPQGYGYNISINASVTDEDGVDTVLFQITYPNSTEINYTVTNITSNIYNYILADIWTRGTYNFTVIANDTAGNVNNTESSSFIVGITATIGVFTLNSSYYLNQQVDLTDPPPVGETRPYFIQPEEHKKDTDGYTDIIIFFKDDPVIKYKELVIEEAKKDVFRIMKGFFIGKEKSINNFVDKKVNTHKEKIRANEKTIEASFDFITGQRWDYAISGVSGKIKDKDIEKLKKMDFVENVWRDTTTISIQLSGSVTLINADDVWNEQNASGSNITGLGVTVAVLDTGIDYEHPFFGGCNLSDVTSGNCERIEYMYDFYNDDNDAFDDHYHGTHCAGIVGGFDSNNNYTGVAPNVTFVIYKVCSASGSCPDSSIISALNNASSYGVDVISISLGGAGYISVGSSLYTTIENVYDAGTIIIASAGNSGPSVNSVGLPASFPVVIAVGASKDDDSMASFSSRGFAYWANNTVAAIKPDLVAPGHEIISAYPIRFGATDNVTSLSGTSMSAPHVAGVAALMIQTHPDWNVTQIKSSLIHGTKALSSSYDPNDVGTGRTDALKAYNMKEVIIPHNQFMGENINTIDTYWSSLKVFQIQNLNNVSVNYTLSISTTDTNYNYTLNTSSIVIAPDETGYFSLNVSTNNSNSRLQNTWATIQFKPNTSANTYNVPIGMKDFVNPEGCEGAPFYINNNTIVENMSCVYSIAQGYSVFVMNSSNASLTCINSSIGGMWYGSAVGGSDIDNVTVTGCDFYNFYTPFSFHDSTNIRIINNNIHDSYTFGIFGVIDDIYYSETDDVVGVDNLYIYNNTFESATSTQSILWDTGLIIRSSDNITVDNNIFNYSGSRALMIYGPIWNFSSGTYVSSFVNLNATISNNIFVNATYPIDIANFKGAKIINNTLQNNYIVLLRESVENLVDNTTFIGTDSHYYTNYSAGISIGRQSSMDWAERSVNETIRNTNINVVFYALVIQEAENLEIQDSNITCYKGFVDEFDDPCIGFQNGLNSTTVSMLNTTFNESQMKWDYGGGSSNNTINVTIKWWSDITIKDTTDNTVSGVDVVVYENSSGTWNSVYSGTTDSNGKLLNAKMPQKIIVINETNTTTTIYYLNITASKENYLPNSTTIYNLSTNTDYELAIEDLKSMINNIGSTDFKGYLTIKAQKNVSGTWTDYEIVTNNVLYNISSGNYMALDTIWYANGSYMTNETGTFRVLAEFKDPSGNVLQTDSLTYLNSTDTFTVSAETTPPVLTIVSPINQNYTTTNIWFNITADENISTCLVEYGAGNNTMSNTSMTSWYHNNASVAEGTHNAIFWCNDTSGNENSTSVYFTVDSIGPSFGTHYAWNVNNESIELNYTTDENYTDNWNVSDPSGINVSSCLMYHRNYDHPEAAPVFNYYGGVQDATMDADGYRNITCLNETINSTAERIYAYYTQQWDYFPVTAAMHPDDFARDASFEVFGNRKFRIKITNHTTGANKTLEYVFDILNKTNTVSPSIAYLCNTSDVSDETTDPNCGFIAAGLPTSTRNAAGYAFGITTSDANGMVAGVLLTETMYVIGSCPDCTNINDDWEIPYTTGTDNDYSETSVNGGSSWTNLGGEFILVSYYFNNISLQHKLNMSDNLGNYNSTTESHNYGAIPEQAPSVLLETDNVTGGLVSYYDIHNVTEKGIIWINITVEDNEGDDLNCSFTLLNNDSTINTTLLAVYELNASAGVCAYEWNTSLFADTDYRLRFNATDGDLIKSRDSSGYIKIDNTLPIISSIQATSITSSSATITWTTDENANSSLSISPAGSYSNSASYTTAHSIAVSNLASTTTHTYTVTSCDAAGNCANTSGNTFDTLTADGGGGGGGGCEPSWICTDWSSCVDGLQTRTCEDENKCGDTSTMPDLSQACTIEPPTIPENKTNFTIIPDELENYTWPWTPIDKGEYYQTRILAVISSLFSLNIGAMLTNIVASLGDYYYRPSFGWGALGIIFMHITPFIGMSVIFGLILRNSKILLKARTTYISHAQFTAFKSTIYFIVIPMLALFITLFMPSV